MQNANSISFVVLVIVSTFRSGLIFSPRLPGKRHETRAGGSCGEYRSVGSGTRRECAAELKSEDFSPTDALAFELLSS
jgi:hypothetical protein